MGTYWILMGNLLGEHIVIFNEARLQGKPPTGN